MLPTQTLRTLDLAPLPGQAASHLSAASGLARVGSRLYVVADDENWLAAFEMASGEPGVRVQLFDGDLPAAHKPRKAAKADVEALTALPPLPGYAFGALLAMGSGSRPARERAALIALDAQGQLQGAVHALDLAPLFLPLRARYPDLNIEAAFVCDGMLCLLQRGNRASASNACIRFGWSGIANWLAGVAAAPQDFSVTHFNLGDLDGVPLSFTDGAALPGGAWVFSAAAEDTSDSYADGRCTGSVVGVVSAAGAVQVMHPLSRVCKVEGVVATVNGACIDLLLVTDADDRDSAALLLSATLAIDAEPAT